MTTFPFRKRPKAVIDKVKKGYLIEYFQQALEAGEAPTPELGERALRSFEKSYAHVLKEK